MCAEDQLTLPGFSTIKRIKQSHGVLLLLEYDLLLWREHQAVLDRRGKDLPKMPRARDVDARKAWLQSAKQKMEQPLPTIKPIGIWKLGRYSGAGVLPWLQGQREPLTSAQVSN